MQVRAVQRQSIGIQTEAIVEEEVQLNQVTGGPDENQQSLVTAAEDESEAVNRTDWRELLDNIRDDLEGLRSLYSIELSAVSLLKYC